MQCCKQHSSCKIDIGVNEYSSTSKKTFRSLSRLPKSKSLGWSLAMFYFLIPLVGTWKAAYAPMFEGTTWL